MKNITDELLTMIRDNFEPGDIWELSDIAERYDIDDIFDEEAIKTFYDNYEG